MSEQRTPIEITELVVYPVKSLRGVSLPSSAVERRGLRYDRRWMIVDEDGLFLTQRKLYKMALIDTAITGDGLVLTQPGYGEVRVPFEPGGPTRDVTVWNFEGQAVEVSEEANQWVSDALGVKAALVHMPESTERPLTAPGAHEGDVVAFSDGNPILIASQASIDDLNGRLEREIPIRRFRPNVVVRGCGPFEEDTWERIEFGGVTLRKTMRSGRCLVTTIDIETAVPSDEPLRTLNTYRKDGTHVWFGCYYAPETLGEISVGSYGDARHD